MPIAGQAALKLVAQLPSGAARAAGSQAHRRRRQLERRDRAGVEGCAALLVALSAAAVASPNVQQEVPPAWESRQPVLPLLVERAPLPDSPRYALPGRQWIELLERPDDAWLPEALRALAGLGIAAPAGASVAA